MPEQVHDRSAVTLEHRHSVPKMESPYLLQYFAHESTGRWFRFDGKTWLQCDMPGVPARFYTAGEGGEWAG
jgi:hypothetical protein